MEKGLQCLMNGPTYLDLDLLINGAMDAFLLVLTARLTQQATNVKRLAVGVLLGAIPILLAITPYNLLLTISKIITPFLMVLAAFPLTTLNNYIKLLLVFWLLSAGLGGMIYALWGWMVFYGEGAVLQLGPKHLWVLPLAAVCWWFIQKLYQKWQFRHALLERTVYDLVVKFEESGDAVEVKAMVDTGNALRDPLTGTPVILLEEAAVSSEMPEEWQEILRSPIQGDPWAKLWQTDPNLVKHLVFIPYQAVGQKSWLPGIRPHRVICAREGQTQEIQATIALINQRLNVDGAYQALLHPEHIQRGGVK